MEPTCGKCLFSRKTQQLQSKTSGWIPFIKVSVNFCITFKFIRESQLLRFPPLNANLMVTKFTGCISSIKASVENFFHVKSYLTAKQCSWLIATQNWDQSSQKLVNGMIALTNWTRYPAKQLLSFFPSRSQSTKCFCRRYSKIKMFFFLFVSSKNWWASIAKVMQMFDGFLVKKIFFSKSTGWVSPSRCQLTSFRFRRTFKQETLRLIACSLHLITWNSRN